jgi:cytosine/uracil/thiamine/allantoin permease
VLLPLLAHSVSIHVHIASADQMVIHGQGLHHIALPTHLLTCVKAIIVPATWIAMMIWAFVRVPSSTGLFDQHASLAGAPLSWAWLSALNSALGIYSTLAVNIPDFTVSLRGSLIIASSDKIMYVVAVCKE